MSILKAVRNVVSQVDKFPPLGVVGVKEQLAVRDEIADSLLQEKQRQLLLRSK